MKQMTMLMMGCSGSALTARMVPGNILGTYQNAYGVIGIPVTLNQIKTRHQIMYGVIGGILELNTLNIKRHTMYAVVGE